MNLVCDSGVGVSSSSSSSSEEKEESEEVVVVVVSSKEAVVDGGCLAPGRIASTGASLSSMVITKSDDMFAMLPGVKPNLWSSDCD